MTPASRLYPRSSDFSEPSSAFSERLMQHIARLSVENKAIFVPGFGRHSAPSALEQAVVNAIAESAATERDRRRSSGDAIMAPPRAVVVLVTHHTRALQLRDLLSTHAEIRVAIAQLPRASLRKDDHQSGNPRGSNRAIANLFQLYDVVIARDWHVLKEFNSGLLTMFRISMIVFDQAELAYRKAHVFSVLMREYYRCLTITQRPRVLAIATVHHDFRITAPVAENVYAEFPSENGKGPDWRCVQKFGEHDHHTNLVDVEYILYQQQSGMLTAGASHKPQNSDCDIMVSELGTRAVVSYQNFLKRRGLSELYGVKFKAAVTNKISDQRALHGLTSKVISLLHVLRKAYEASTSEDTLMAIVHAGHPVVAVALHAIISDLRGFDGIVCRVILGDESSAKPLERLRTDHKGWQGAETDDEAVDDFGSGYANVLIVASSNIDCISQSRRPLPPCPLVIRFDGSLVNPVKDGGGGRCRVIVFEPRGYSSAHKRSHRTRKRKASVQEVDVSATVDEEVDYDTEDVSDTQEVPDADYIEAETMPDANVPDAEEQPDAIIPDMADLPDVNFVEEDELSAASVPDLEELPDANVPDVEKLTIANITHLEPLRASHDPVVEELPDSTVPQVEGLPDANALGQAQLPDAIVSGMEELQDEHDLDLEENPVKFPNNKQLSNAIAPELKGLPNENVTDMKELSDPLDDLSSKALPQSSQSPSNVDSPHDKGCRDPLEVMHEQQASSLGCQPSKKASLEPSEKAHGQETLVSVVQPFHKATEPVPIPLSSAKYSKKRKRSSMASKANKVVRFSENAIIGRDQQSTEAVCDKIASIVHPAIALIGPQGADECYLYGLSLLVAKDERLRSRVQEISNPGGIEDYGVILSKKLNQRDLTISLGDLGLSCHVNDKVGKVGLVFLGAIKLTPKQTEQAQLFVACLFSSIQEDIDLDSFVWGKRLKIVHGDRSFDADYFRNYLVVPVIRKGKNESLSTTGSPSRKLSRRIISPSDRAQAADKSCINWQQVSAVIAQFHKDTTKNKSELFPTPMPRDVLEGHMEKLQSNLVYVICARKKVLLAGDLRYDQSPLSYIHRRKLFALNADGTIKPDKYIASLINPEEEEDPEGLTKPSLLFMPKRTPPQNAQKEALQKPISEMVRNENNSGEVIEVVDLTSDGDENLQRNRPKAVASPISPSPTLIGQKPKRSTGGPRQIFSAHDNRKNNRKSWKARILQTHEDYQKDTRKIQIQFLDQALITTIDPPRLTMDHFVDMLQGTPVREVISGYVEGAKEKWCMVPELCRVHPISIGSMFLPSSLMVLERHVLLCELRDLFMDKVGVPISLKLLAQAVTSTSVDPLFNYERLEFLGDSVLKISSTLRLFTAHPHDNEGRMHEKRKDVVSNEALRQKAHLHKLEKFLCFEQQYVEDWNPPGSELQRRVVTMNSKSLADVMEALCAVMYLSGSEEYYRNQVNTIDLTGSSGGGCGGVEVMGNLPMLSAGAIKQGYEAGVKFYELLGVFEGREPTHKETLLAAIHSLHPEGSAAPTEIIPQAFPRDFRLASPIKPWNEEFGPLEKILGYKFKRRHLLVCALTHGSYVDVQRSLNCKTMVETFQRMEFLGDAVVDLCVVLYLYDKYTLLGPDQLTELKAQIVSNETFARVSVEFGLHKFLFMDSPCLTNAIARFEEEVKKAIECGEDTVSCAAPKVLSDVFESILGAIVVDSGLEAAWKVAMKLLRETLTKRADLSKGTQHPMRKLEILVTQTLRITRSQPLYEYRTVKGDKFECDVKIAGNVVATERADSKKMAQLLVAKNTHSRLKNAKPGSADAKLIDKLRAKALKKEI